METTKALRHKALRPIRAFISKSPTCFALSGIAADTRDKRKRRPGAALRELEAIENAFLQGKSATRPHPHCCAHRKGSAAGSRGPPCRRRHAGAHTRVLSLLMTDIGGAHNHKRLNQLTESHPGHPRFLGEKRTQGGHIHSGNGARDQPMHRRTPERPSGQAAALVNVAATSCSM
ncbi:hypothetical protein Y023_4954 [Burkholderia pseudomallei A79D]|nr:hypothetical protein Y023_4954 [Burkholderia pseudomallei A79D]KGX97843.1 hypothetical protein X997_4629 [Burkholderia pseudomallei A79C]